MTRILYVEDNDDNVYMLKMRLELLDGFEVLSAEDGKAGCAKAATEFPDIILMDLDLPVIDGWEATRRLKNDTATRHIPIIALTAHAMSGFTREGACRRLRRVRHKTDRFRPAHAEDQTLTFEEIARR